MNISEFTTRVLNKLFITEQDSKQFGYDSKIIPTLNECLTFIANDVLANRVTIPFDVAYDTNGIFPNAHYRATYCRYCLLTPTSLVRRTINLRVVLSDLITPANT